KTKPAKIDSLKEKIFCARPLKEKEIFAGFVRRQAASLWGGISARQGRNCCSKKVRTSFSNCDHPILIKFPVPPRSAGRGRPTPPPSAAENCGNASHPRRSGRAKRKGVGGKKFLPALAFRFRFFRRRISCPARRTMNMIKKLHRLTA
ncbi:MAG: hypothetical protein COT36_02165, partial [Parcubacteria group bacterium CG08_land_8_20_14_0_20_38_56]